MKEKQALTKLFENYIDDLFSNTKEMAELTRKIVEIEDKLYPTLTKEQREQIEEMQKLEYKRSYEAEKNIFIEAFSLATQLFVERNIKIAPQLNHLT